MEADAIHGDRDPLSRHNFRVFRDEDLRRGYGEPRAWNLNRKLPHEDRAVEPDLLAAGSAVLKRLGRAGESTWYISVMREAQDHVVVGGAPDVRNRELGRRAREQRARNRRLDVHPVGPLPGGTLRA